MELPSADAHTNADAHVHTGGEGARAVWAMHLSKAISPNRIFRYLREQRRSPSLLETFANERAPHSPASEQKKNAGEYASDDFWLELFSLSADQLRARGFLKSEHAYEGRDVLLRKVDKEAAICAQKKIFVTPYVSPRYPQILRTIHVPPLLLYHYGSLPRFDYEKDSVVAIVGTRNSEVFINEFAEQLAAGITRHGGHVISGLALGVDTMAHRGALLGAKDFSAAASQTNLVQPARQAHTNGESMPTPMSAPMSTSTPRLESKSTQKQKEKQTSTDTKPSNQHSLSPTTAVLASGVDHIYPYSNRGLYQEILEQGGCILSEYGPGVNPMSYHFPIRNRIIAGLSRAVFMAQAGKRSGALITTGYAGDYGRTLYTYGVETVNPLPEAYAGNLRLIEEGAHAINSVEDFLVHFGLKSPASTSSHERSISSSYSTPDALNPEQLKTSPVSSPLASHTGSSGESIKISPADSPEIYKREILRLLKSFPASLPELAEKLGTDTASLAAIVMDLMLAEDIREISPNRYAIKK